MFGDVQELLLNLHSGITPRKLKGHMDMPLNELRLAKSYEIPYLLARGDWALLQQLCLTGQSKKYHLNSYKQDLTLSALIVIHFSFFSLPFPSPQFNIPLTLFLYVFLVEKEIQISEFYSKDSSNK